MHRIVRENPQNDFCATRDFCARDNTNGPLQHWISVRQLRSWDFFFYCIALHCVLGKNVQRVAVYDVFIVSFYNGHCCSNDCKSRRPSRPSSVASCVSMNPRTAKKKLNMAIKNWCWKTRKLGKKPLRYGKKVWTLATYPCSGASQECHGETLFAFTRQRRRRTGVT